MVIIQCHDTHKLIGEASALKTPSLPTKLVRLERLCFVFQEYQADLLKYLEQGQGLHRTMDLALSATKPTAAMIGQSMVAMVVIDRHLWLNLAERKELSPRCGSVTFRALWHIH